MRTAPSRNFLKDPLDRPLDMMLRRRAVLRLRVQAPCQDVADHGLLNRRRGDRRAPRSERVHGPRDLVELVNLLLPLVLLIPS